MKVPTIYEKDIVSSPYSRVIISNSCLEHNHSFFEFSICTFGKVKNFINGQVLDMERGHIILLRPTDVHYFSAEEKHASRDVYVSQSVMRAVCDSVDRSLFPILLKNPLVINFYVNDFQLQILENKLNFFNDVAGKNDLQIKTMHRSVVLDLIQLWQESVAKKQQGNLPDWILILLSQLGTEKFLNKNIEEIAHSTNYSHGYVCREFKKHMGRTLQEYLADARFSYCLSLLASKELTIAQIAEKLGYNATPNFIIAFKNRFGVTPAKWREKLKQS